MRIAIMVVALLGLGCQEWEEVHAPVCRTDIFAIIATVRDSVTHLPAGGGATGYLVARTLVGFRSEELVGFHMEELVGRTGGFRMTGVGNGPGNYTVTVEKAGYHPWRREKLAVLSSGCGDGGVRATRLEVLLQPIQETGTAAARDLPLSEISNR